MLPGTLPAREVQYVLNKENQTQTCIAETNAAPSAVVSS
jgi:hypothetical protein